MNVNLYDHQIIAMNNLKNGSILCADVGTGKSRTALAYYFFKDCGGKCGINGKGKFEKMKNPRDLYIITTAKKRDSKEWEVECSQFQLSNDILNPNGTKVIIDSWNNIKKYVNVYGAFFIFDEQRVVGRGSWVKSFLKIANKNHWILLSATPGDTWSDYVPVFIANGFYKNITDFNNCHAVFNPYTKYPKIDRYVNTGRLVKLRNDILVNMRFEKKVEKVKSVVYTQYDKEKYKLIFDKRWDPYENEPIPETGALFYLMRRVVNSDPSRIEATRKIIAEKKRVIIFYNFTYELEMLRDLCSEMDIPFSEWNGQNHDDILEGDSWAYLVQYTAGSEGWNCTTTDTIIFYSQNYSYRTTVQAAGRIDRLNTPYDKLYFYYLRSQSPIDKAIFHALSQKKRFNESSFIVK